MRIYKYPTREIWHEIISRPEYDPEPLRKQVSSILKRVREEGDEAVRYYTRHFDKVEIKDFLVPAVQVSGAGSFVMDDLKNAIDIALKNVTRFHEQQIIPHETIITSPGVKCWLKTEPIEKIGLYIPGGSAPLISTVLMLGVPARLTGCREIIMCTPPGKNGEIHPALLYTAGVLGIDKIFRIGGAQAIGAMAYGTDSIPAVYKIFGPGNQYVTIAKQLVSLDGIAIDFPAGPSEVVVLADYTADPVFVASDLLAQAEHGPDSQAILVTDHEPLLKAVQSEVSRQLINLPRKSYIEESLTHSCLLLMNDIEEMIEIINAYAPEHLIIMTENYDEQITYIRNAGSVFLGHYSPESAGDYASGTNHTLPTNGYARAFSGIGLNSFQKVISIQEITKKGLQNLAPAIEHLAEAESLLAHKNAVAVRLG